MGQQASVAQQLPNLQSLTGGSLSPEYAAQFGALQSGLGNDPQASGNIQAAINQYFGLAAPGNSGLTSNSMDNSFLSTLKSIGFGVPSSASPGAGSGTGSGSTDNSFMDTLKNIGFGSSSGSTPGGGGSPGGGGGYAPWIQQVLSGNEFKGLAG